MGEKSRPFWWRPMRVLLLPEYSQLFVFKETSGHSDTFLLPFNSVECIRKGNRRLKVTRVPNVMIFLSILILKVTHVMYIFGE